MSRHRNVRSMNYSEEYEGFDDVYGHSVEDDHCISPSDAGFLYDRTRYPQMSAFISEDNYIAEEEEQSNVEFKKIQKSNLNDVDIEKLRFCVDEIQNVIGDMVPLSTIEEVAISCSFDLKIALDQILNEAEMKQTSVTEETSTERQKKAGNKERDEGIEGSLGSRHASSTALLSGGGDGPEHSLKKFLIPKLKCVELENIEQGVNNLNIFEGTSDSFSSLKMLMDQHRKDIVVGNIREVPERNVLESSSPSTLAEFSESFLNAQNPVESPSQPRPASDGKTGFIIPKLQKRKAESPENWIIDLSSALRLEPGSDFGGNNFGPDRIETENDTSIPGRGVAGEETGPRSEFDQRKNVKVEIDLHNENSSPFGRILCRKWKGHVFFVERAEKVIPERVVPFDFTTPSPDDIYLKYIRRK